MNPTKVFIHHSSYVDEGAKIGESTKIWHFSHIMSSAIIGTNCIIGQNVFVGANVIIGNNVKIQNNVSVYDGVIIEDDVFLGPSMVFTNVLNPRSFIERKAAFEKTIIKKGATIGANATILCGNNLGNYCLIGAGATVTKTVKNHALIIGVPGVQKAWVCECGSVLIKNSRSYDCTECGRIFTMDENQNLTKQ